MKLISILALLLMNPIVIFNADSNDIIDWYEVNDTVMGGRSTARITKGPSGNVCFQGDVSLDNNGGFASMRYNVDPQSLVDKDHFVLRVKGDGSSYQFRVKSTRRQQHSHVYTFQTTGEWQEITIPFTDMTPQWRGRLLRMKNYDGDSIAEVGILIGNKKAQEFKILLDFIEAR